MLPNPPAPPVRTAQMTVYADLLSVKVRSQLQSDRDRAGGSYPKRGVISQFTKRSRTRFFRTMAKCRNLDKGYFVTLTYPGDFDYVHQNYKRDLQRIRQRLVGLFPDIRCIWRMEYKVRLSGGLCGIAVPHFHLLLFGDVTERGDALPTFRAWVATSWNRVVAPDDMEHLAAGTQVDTITSRTHAMRYAGKYAAKIGETDTPAYHVGRLWGLWGNWDIRELLSIALEMPLYAFLKVYVANHVRASKNERAWQYGMHLMRAPDNKGINVLGLGDLSGDYTGENNSAILRIIGQLPKKQKK